MSTSMLRRISRDGGTEHEDRDEERRHRVARRPARPHRDETGEDGDRPCEVTPEMQRVGEQCRAVVLARGPQRHDRAREVDREHERDRDEHPPVRVDARVTQPASRATARLATATLTSESTAASASAARCSALPWPYWCPRSAGLTAMPTAKNVSRAATRSVPEWSDSATSPSDPLARPVTSLTAISAAAATTETSAARR